MGQHHPGGGIDRPSLEKQWTSRAARDHLSHEDLSLFDRARFTFRPFVYFDKILIAWKLVKGEPQVLEVFTVIGLDVSLQDGIWLRLHASIADRDIEITHVPKRLLPGLDIMGWMPFFNEFRYVSGDWSDPAAKRSLRLHACFKMQSDEPSEGQTHLSEMHIFRGKWPQYAKTRF